MRRRQKSPRLWLRQHLNLGVGEGDTKLLEAAPEEPTKEQRAELERELEAAGEARAEKEDPARNPAVRGGGSVRRPQQASRMFEAHPRH